MSGVKKKKKSMLVFVSGRSEQLFSLQTSIGGVINEAAAKKGRSINVSFPSSPSQEPC